MTTPSARTRPPPAGLRAVLVALCALCALGLAAGPASAEAPPAPAEIDAAIAKGVAWLLEEQKPQGPWGSGKHAVGKTALATFALLHCGLAADQGTGQARRLGRALTYLDRHGAGRTTRRETDTRTYEAALLLMVLRSRGRPEDRPRMQRLADLLAGTQARNGQWWYDGKGAPHIDVGDNSNTQFATLALGVAHGEGLTVPRHVFARGSRWWLQAAGPKGGFGYATGGSPKSAATGSMTAAGIACMAIHRTILAAQAAQPADTHAPPTRGENVHREAVAFLADVFSVSRNHGPAIDRKNQRQRLAGRGWVHYYLWTVERAMVLSGLEKLGSHDWYAQGARHLLDTQKKDGSWRQEHPLYATCFALLFLTRAADPARAFTPRATAPAPRPAPGPVTPGPAEPPAAAPSPPLIPAQPARPFPPGSPAEWLALDLPVGELARRCRLLGAVSLAPLVRALGAPDRVRRARAWEALTGLLPDERTRGADRHPLRRGRLALWLRLRSRFLVLESGRFVLP